MKKLSWLSSALVFCLLIVSASAHAQPSKASPFDGMSAIQIEIAAANRRKLDSNFANHPMSDSPAASGSELSFDRCDLIELKGRPGHEGEFPIPGEPLPGEATALLVFTGFAQSAEFRLVDTSGDLLTPVDLEPLPGQTFSMVFLGSFNVPPEPFSIAATGQDESDQTFDLVCERVYSPQSIEVRFEQEISVAKPGPFATAVIVTNHGSAQTFLLEASNDLELLTSITPDSIALEPNESAVVSVELDIPQISSGQLQFQLRATATAEGNPGQQNYGQATLRVERFESVFEDDFE